MTISQRNASCLVALALLAVVLSGACNRGATGSDAEVDAPTDVDDGRWVRSFPEDLPCTGVDVRGAVRLTDSFSSHRLHAGEPEQSAHLGWAGDSGYVLYDGGRSIEGPRIRIRTLGSDGAVGEPQFVDDGSWCGSGAGRVRSVGRLIDGRFRFVFESGELCADDPGVIEEYMKVYYIGELDPVERVVIDSSIRYFNGIGQYYPPAPWYGWHFEIHGGRVFEEIPGYLGDPYVVGEVDPDWDKTWDDYLPWFRWVDWSPLSAPEDVDVTMLGDKYIFAWVGRDELLGRTLLLGSGHRPLTEADEELYEHQVELRELREHTDCDCPSWVRLTAGETTFAVFRQDWAQLFDAELNEVAPPVNFGPNANSVDDSGFNQTFFGGGWYVFVHRSLQWRGVAEGWLDEGMAATFVDESGRVAGRYVLACLQGEQPADALHRMDLQVLDAVWTGEGFWMLFTASIPDTMPVDRDLWVIFVPAP
ncbi:MAG: hypothetical protein JXB32_12865 [Deltaproteobacteria bacterium]|nr:hypothetical protein [Deltaproteobacteria bacterium]